MNFRPPAPLRAATLLLVGAALSACAPAARPPGIDTHIHLYEQGRIVWKGPQAERLNPSHLPADFLTAARGTGIGRGVIVEASEDPAENDWMLECAGRDPCIAAVIANVRLDSPGFAAAVDRLAARPKFRGVRDRTATPIDRAGPQTAANLRHLAIRDLVLEVQANPALDTWILETAAAHPRLTVIIDHLGSPHLDPQGAPRPGWREFITQAGALPNVWCKLSAFDAAQGGTYPPADMARLGAVLDHVLAAFGNERVLFGSNWPVSPKAGPYRDMVDLLAAHASARPGFPLEQILRENPRRAYRLDQSQE
jgi:L-fuconolactonase